METSVKAVRSVLPAESHRRSTVVGMGFFVLAIVLYTSTFVGLALSSTWWARTLMTLVNGLMIGVLFIVGHDACHGSLTPSSKLNSWLGHLAFLPSLHPYCAWEYSHNALHHGWTNLRGKDPVYCPRTLDEFHQLSPRQRFVERLYRSWLGLLPLYLVTIWWKLEIVPSASHRSHIEKRGNFVLDRAMVLSVPAIQLAVASMLAQHAGASGGAAVLIGLLAAVGPFLTFTWLIGFATFQHHTHPRVVWYDDESTWNFFRAQVQGTVHVEFPRWIELLLNNIMEHTAHHVDPRIPLYNLTRAQDAIEEAYGEAHVISERFTFAMMTDTFRRCQLYDFNAQCWLTFAGVPTTTPRRACESANSA